MTIADVYMHDFLEWIGELTEEISEKVFDDKQKLEPDWDLEWLNSQLYSVLSETATGTLKETVMQREKEVKTNGAEIFRDLSRDYLDSSKEGIVALGQRVVKPSRATMETFEDRLRAWEQDVKRLDRLSKSGKVSEE